jgi:hypothetical protein
MRIYKVVALLLVLSVLLLIGCTQKGTSGDTDTTDTDPETSIADTTSSDTTVLEETTATKDEADPSLVAFRQSMVETPHVFGVAYLGYTLDSEPVKFSDFVSYTPLALYNDLPFIPAIPEERVIVNGMGEVYCIVPLDEKATISVKMKSSADTSDAFDNEIYSSSNGEPIILFCNDGGEYPDTLITVTTSAGNSFEWYPSFRDSRIEAGETIKDFTPYVQLLATDYDEMKDTYWVAPDKKELVGTMWYCEELQDTGNLYWYSIGFLENTVYISWNNDGEYHEYKDAPYTLTEENGVWVLTFDFGGFAGEQRCCVLLGSDGDMLYTCADFTNGKETISPYSDVQSRILDKTIG